MNSSTRLLGKYLLLLLILCMLFLLFAPLLGLLSASSFSKILIGIKHPLFGPALWLSLRTSFLSLSCVVLFGTPVAWWLAQTQHSWSKWIELLVDLPIVIPPAVIGVALLYTFGRGGLFGSFLVGAGIQIPFTMIAVVLAQIVISAPFYIQSATSAFRGVDKELLLVARTLGQSSSGVFFRVVIPLSLPGLFAGAALSWGRALGEFGATLLFAGNLSGKTQTMPLAIYTALESDVRLALVLSLLLAGFGVFLLFMLRFVPRVFARRLFLIGKR